MKGLLKFITCGSVDDGKSTLIGHILYDAKLLYADQEKTLELDSKVGSRSGAIDYSLLLDGLMAEREQGITIDVAYRYFTTDNRSFIVADTPGHEEYTVTWQLAHPSLTCPSSWWTHPRRSGTDQTPCTDLQAHGYPLFRLCRKQDGSGGLQRSTFP